MITKYDTGDRVLVPATIKTAQLIGGKILHQIRECNALAFEDTILGKCPDCSGQVSGEAKQSAWPLMN